MKFYYLLLLSIVFISCSSDDDMAFEDVEITPVEIAKGNVFNLDFQPNTTINSFIDNEDFWLFFVENTWQIPNPPPEADVNFDDDFVIVCVDHIRTTTGYDVTIQSVTEKALHVEIVVEYKKSVDGEIRNTRPYHIVKIPQTQKDLKFTRIGL
ncbi:MAG: protease complex subunit PrcB family protein [Flavobacteriaceae bacterium]|nr:protease complex subunit PrcB family protein [Flavobacteriaceae bacterium]